MADRFGGVGSADALAGAEEAARAIREAMGRDPWNLPYVERGRSSYEHRHPVFGEGSSPEEKEHGRVYRWCDEHPVALWLVVWSVIVATGLILAITVD